MDAPILREVYTGSSCILDIDFPLVPADLVALSSRGGSLPARQRRVLIHTSGMTSGGIGNLRPGACRACRNDRSDHCWYGE